jgi:hypothetical protein
LKPRFHMGDTGGRHFDRLQSDGTACHRSVMKAA